MAKSLERRLSEALNRQVTQEMRHGGRAAKQQAILEWYGKQLERKIDMTFDQRLAIASSFVLRQVKLNISRPVLKYQGFGYKTVGGVRKKVRKTKVWPQSRSKPGEYPKKDTAELFKSTYSELLPRRFGKRKAVIATNLGYGLLLESKMNRSFLRRTLHESQAQLRRIMVKPIS